MITDIINYLSVAFIGFAIGRIGHIYSGHLSGPDHWIYGLLLFLPGILFSNYFTVLLSFFGIGLFVSDMRDFINLKFWGPDKVEIKKFWGID